MTGDAKDRVIEANKKAFEGRDTQDASRGNAPNPALDAEDVGESTSRRGEEIARSEGPDEGREDLGPKGPTGRPAGTSTVEAGTGVDPQKPVDPDMPNVQSGDHGG
jgi:hypothetical protein